MWRCFQCSFYVCLLVGIGAFSLLIVDLLTHQETVALVQLRLFLGSCSAITYASLFDLIGKFHSNPQLTPAQASPLLRLQMKLTLIGMVVFTVAMILTQEKLIIYGMLGCALILVGIFFTEFAIPAAQWLYRERLWRYGAIQARPEALSQWVVLVRYSVLLVGIGGLIAAYYLFSASGGWGYLILVTGVALAIPGEWFWGSEWDNQAEPSDSNKTTTS